MKLTLLVILAIAAGAAWWSTGHKSAPAEEPRAEPVPTRSSSAKPTRARLRSPGDEEAADSLIPDEELQDWLQQAGRDPSGTLAKIISIPDSPRRRELLDWVLSAWSIEDRAPALDWLGKTLPSMPAEPAKDSMDILLGSWALEEPLSAMDWAEANAGSRMKADGFQSIAEHWATSDPEEMSDWILANRPSSDIWAHELLHAVMADDPERALEWCDRLSDEKLAKESREGVIQSWLLTSPDEAAAYLKEHPEFTPETLPVPPSPED